MGVLYSITPLDQFAEEANKTWLDAIGFAIPSAIPPSRNPTAKEVRVVLEALDGYTITYHLDEWTWTADIINSMEPDGPDWTIVHLSDFEGVEDQPTPIFFEKGSEELIVRIVEQLSQLCGPLVVDNDIDGAPLLMTPGIDRSIALRQWWSISERIKALTPNRKRLGQFTDEGDVVRSFDLTEEVRKLLRRNKKISAITLYQRYIGCTLEEARRYIESL